jgi:hypothetical protein
MSRWQRSAVSPGADSTRIYYLEPNTGEVCFRTASWKPGGRFVADNGSPGIGVNFNSKGRILLTGRVYPPSEFE